MKLLAISVASWLTGLVAYVAALGLIWHQSVGGDLQAVVFWSALASAIATLVVYAPVMFALRKRIGSVGAWWPFSFVGAGLGIFPVALIIAMFGGGLRSATSPQAMLFFLMFAAFGLVFGAGFFLAYGRAST